MKSPMLLWKELALEFGERCQVDTHRDFKTVTGRTNLEGLSFLTITLPSFAKDFDEALGIEAVTPDHFLSFKKWQGLPRFLGGFLELVFDRQTGVLLDTPSIDAIVAIRQLTRVFSKVELPCSEIREKEAYDGYVKTDQELEASMDRLSDEEIRSFSRMAARLWSDVLHGLDILHTHHELVPKHGPGATADRLSGNRKFEQQEWTERLESGGFHAVDYLLPNHRHWKGLSRVEFLAPGAERPARVISVPKTQKTPRIIAIEPTCMQYTQQAVCEALEQLIEEDDLVSRFISPRSQQANRNMARKGSITGSLATLDLSEASDRVSAQLVWELASYSETVIDCLFATRSRRAEVPGHGIISLTKYASMGSALCFPVEQMVFLTIIFLGIQNQIGRQLQRKDIKSFAGRVHLFGDDIIVPVEYALAVREALETYGLRVNSSKSFWSGNFRESCGEEYYKGYDVSVVKLRALPPQNSQDAQGVVSLVAFRNLLANRGFDRSVDAIDEYLLGILGWFPWVQETSPVLGRVDLSGFYEVAKIDPSTQRPLVRGWMVDAKIPQNALEGEGALLKHFLKRGELPFADKKHLERSGRPRVVGIKLGYGPSF